MGIPAKYFEGQANVGPFNRESKPDLASLLNGIFQSPVQTAVAVAGDTVTLANAGPILFVNATAATSAGPKAMQDEAPDAGEVQVTYDADGIPTLNFNNGDAVTAISVHQLTLPTIPA